MVECAMCAGACSTNHASSSGEITRNPAIPEVMVFSGNSAGLSVT